MVGPWLVKRSLYNLTRAGRPVMGGVATLATTSSVYTRLKREKSRVSRRKP